MMNERPMDSSYGFAAGLLIGMACGSVLALLFAPKAGTELRGDINNQMGSMRDAFGRRYRDIADKASAGVEQVKEKAQGMSQKAQGLAADARDFVQSKVQQGRNEAEQSTQH
jgi:gas vesicle protein